MRVYRRLTSAWRGEVLFKDGDYFGQTATARIADFARPGEVLVSQAVVDAGGHSSSTFTTSGRSSSAGRFALQVAPPAERPLEVPLDPGATIGSAAAQPGHVAAPDS